MSEVKHTANDNFSPDIQEIFDLGAHLMRQQGLEFQRQWEETE